MHLERYQLPLLRSFLQIPQVHVEASRSPELVGGPFASLPPSCVSEVTAFVEETERIMRPHLLLARQLHLFQRWSTIMLAG